MIIGPNQDKKTGIHYGVIGQNSIDADTLAAIIDGAMSDGTFHSDENWTLHRAATRYRIFSQKETDLEGQPMYWSNGFGWVPKGATLFDADKVTQMKIGVPVGDGVWVPDTRGELDGGYIISSMGVTEMLIHNSPFFTYANLCSPCAPNCGHLDDIYKPTKREQGQLDTLRQIAPNAVGEAMKSYAIETSVPTFCFGPMCFRDEKPPYPVFDVATGNLEYDPCVK